MPEYVVALTTCSPDEAKHLATELVQQRFCACVNIVSSVTSVYRWRGEINSDEESLLVMKTERARVSELERTLRSLHSYELPEFIVLDISSGSDDYLSWVSEMVAQD
ncbi:MAG: divalent-cation tolerance protein CutA [Candidatus Thorarchaeota archaeon]